MKLKVTREKRPDRIIASWKKYEVWLSEDNKIGILTRYHSLLIPLSEVDNLIQALEEMKK